MFVKNIQQQGVVLNVKTITLVKKCVILLLKCGLGKTYNLIHNKINEQSK